MNSSLGRAPPFACLRERADDHAGVPPYCMSASPTRSLLLSSISSSAGSGLRSVVASLFPASRRQREVSRIKHAEIEADRII